MKKIVVLTCSFIVIFSAGCGPSSEELAVTMVAQTDEAATQTRAAMPTDTPTPTPTNTPPPTLTPMPGLGDVLLDSDTGECPVKTVGVNYQTLEETLNYSGENREGKAYFEISDENTTLNVFCDTLLPPDVQIEFDAEYVTGPDSYAVGLLCRLNLSRWYELAVNSNGSWEIYKYVYGSGYELLEQGISTALNFGEGNNHLAAVCKGDLITLYINDIEVGTARDSEFTDGRIGWSLTTFDHAGVGMEYDNFVVSIPDPDNPPGGAATTMLTAEPVSTSSEECQIFSIYPVTGLTDPISGEELPSYNYVAGGFIPNELLSVSLQAGNITSDLKRADDRGRIAGNITWGVLGNFPGVDLKPPKKMEFSIEGIEDKKCTLNQTVTWP